jgi:protein involved in polysaccharide export with SLBB domain
MFRIRLVIVILYALMLSGCAEMGHSLFGADQLPPMQHAIVQTSDEYRLGTGDVISIRVYGADEEIRLERIRLDNTGMVALPFGEFKARGSTSKELEGAITDNVRGRLLRNPRVWVSVDEYRPFFVDGQVTRPGAYPYQPGLTVRRAVTIAGGFRDRAAPDKILLIREQDSSSRPARVDLNAPIGPGDTLLIQESFF